MLAVSLGSDGAELRSLEPWQAEEFLAHMNRGRDFIGRYVTLADRVTDLATARAFLQMYADHTAADTGRLYGIWASDTLVGGVMFRSFDTEFGIAEAGCWLEPSATGRGLVTRALRVLIDWAVAHRGIHRVEWLASPANAASLAVARRLGMSREGVLRAQYVRRGERQDVEVWSVLAPEWRATREVST